MTILFSGCKINIGLRVLGARPDGYHEIESLFYPLPYPRDHMIIRKGSRPGITVASTDKRLRGEPNIIQSAYEIFAETTGIAPELDVRLKKRIPIGAGLGGGSGNAAVFLKWLNQANGEPLSERQLADCAEKLGSDVPFFLERGPQAVSGRGERMRPAAPCCEGLHIVVAAPDIFMSTPKVFAAWDQLHPGHSLTNKEKRASKCSLQRPPWPRNDLEEAAYAMRPELAAVKSALISAGAAHAAMSGSGSAHFGIFDSPEKARKAFIYLGENGMRRWIMPMKYLGM